MAAPKTILVFGATGQTGRHFVALALEQGYRVRALARDPAKLAVTHPDLEVRQGSVPDVADLDSLVQGADYVVSMLGDKELQRRQQVNTAFVAQLVPAMRRHGVSRFLYQAGGLSKPPDRPLAPVLKALRHTLARGFDGQHRDNEGVMRYLVENGDDVEWVVHRAGIGSDGPSKGVLERSAKRFSVATFVDCAAYSLRLLTDDAAVHTCDLSAYRKG